MSAKALELFLARLYTDEAFMRRFLSDPAANADGAGLSLDEAQALQRIDRPGLLLAAQSYSKKRAHRHASGFFARFRKSMLSWISRVVSQA